MLDVIIAYVVILLVLSTITTAVLQLFQRMLPLRYGWLVYCLVKLRRRFAAAETWRDSIRQARALMRTVGTNPMGQWFPDYVSGATVREWLGTIAPGHDALECDAFEVWWKTFEKQMSASFRVGLVAVSVGVGFVLSQQTGLEAVSVAKHLSESPAEVEALVEDAERDAGSTRRKYDDDMFVRLVERELAAGKAPEEGAEETAEQLAQRRSQARLLVCFDAFAEATEGETPIARAAAIELAVERGTLPPHAKQKDQCALSKQQIEDELLPAVTTARRTIEGGLGFGGYPLTKDPLHRFFGQLLMALFIGLGAPFWFELLNLLRLPVGNKPKES